MPKKGIRWARGPPSDITNVNFAFRKFHKTNIALKTTVNDQKPAFHSRCNNK